MNNRLLNIAVSLAFAVYMSLVAFNNITDYSSNFLFVSKVVGMEDVFSFEHTGWRAMRNPTVHHVLYISIIIAESLTAILLLTGTISMIKAFASPAPVFAKGKRRTMTGLVLGFLIFFVVFLAVAGEWYLMWQSDEYNAQGTAFGLSTLFLLAILIFQKDEA